MTTSHIDATDRRILSAVQRNGRLQNQELAKLVGLSPSPCLRRVRRLEDEGYIDRYGAVLDRAKLGFGITALVSTEIKITPKAEPELLREQILKLPGVEACPTFPRDADFLLEIVAADL